MFRRLQQLTLVLAALWQGQAAAQSPNFPQVMPAFSVYGQIYSSGPGEAIAFTALGQQLAAIPTTWPALQTFSSLLTTSMALNETPGGCTNSPGVRAPLYICNDAITNLAGQSLGLQIWIGNNPTTGVVGVGDSIAFSSYIDNLNGRTSIWAYNPVCFQATQAAGGGFGINHCIEVDVNQNIAAQTPTSAYSGGAVSHGIEFESSLNTSGSAQPPHVAVWITSAADNSATQPWWNFGLSCARINKACLVGEIIAGDAGTAFGTAFIWDKTHAAVSYLDAGTHTSVIDVTGATFTNFANCGTNACVFAGAGGIRASSTGSAAAPILAVGNATTGLYSISTTGLGFSINGALKFDWGVTTNNVFSVLTSFATAAGAVISGGYLSATGAGGNAYPTATNSFAVSWNFSNGVGEADFWNTFQPTSQLAGFYWYQQTGASAGTLLAKLDKTGLLTLTAGIVATAYTVGATAGASCTLTTVSHLTVVNGIVTLCN